MEDFVIPITIVTESHGMSCLVMKFNLRLLKEDQKYYRIQITNNNLESFNNLDLFEKLKRHQEKSLALEKT